MSLLAAINHIFEHDGHTVPHPDRRPGHRREVVRGPGLRAGDRRLAQASPLRRHRRPPPSQGRDGRADPRPDGEDPPHGRSRDRQGQAGLTAARLAGPAVARGESFEALTRLSGFAARCAARGLEGSKAPGEEGLRLRRSTQRRETGPQPALGLGGAPAQTLRRRCEAPGGLHEQGLGLHASALVREGAGEAEEGIGDDEMARGQRGCAGRSGPGGRTPRPLGAHLSGATSPRGPREPRPCRSARTPAPSCAVTAPRANAPRPRPGARGPRRPGRGRPGPPRRRCSPLRRTSGRGPGTLRTETRPRRPSPRAARWRPG